MGVKENLASVTERIHAACTRAGRDPEEINIVAVTKYVTLERAIEAVEAGIVNLGENRDEGIQAKYEAIGTKAVWHFIGTLQTRKVKNIIHLADYIHSLDRVSLAEEINKRTSQTIPCFIQVNTSGEESKHGIKPEELQPFLKELASFPKIEVAGLMTMAPFTEDEDTIRECFRLLRKLRDDVQGMKLGYAPCRHLSMGMSNDFELAIEEGATFIRLGTVLVGDKL